MRILIRALPLILLFSAGLFAQGRNEPARITTITEKVAGMEKFPGYFPFYWDAKSGKLWLEIDKFNSEFL